MGMASSRRTVRSQIHVAWSFSEEAAAEKHMAQLRHDMWVTNTTAAVLSIITGGGKWLEIKIPADSLYQHLLLTAEKKFWRCVESGERPRLFGAEPPGLASRPCGSWTERVQRLGGILQRFSRCRATCERQDTAARPGNAQQLGPQES